MESDDAVMDAPALISLIMGLASFLSGLLLWYKGSVEKRYAAQRDFGHLKRNYQQLSEGVSLQAKEMDRRFDQVEADLREIKILLQVQLAKQGDSISGILGYKKED